MTTRSPVDVMLDQIDWRCVRCGAKKGTCLCFRKITLQCPKCGDTRLVCIEPCDPPNTDRCATECPKCIESEAHRTIAWYDASGAMIE